MGGIEEGTSKKEENPIFHHLFVNLLGGGLPGLFSSGQHA